MLRSICQLRNSLLSRAVYMSSNINFSRLNRDKMKNKIHKVTNPGVENRLKIIKSYAPDTDYTEQLDMDAMESDFMKAEDMYDMHEREEGDLKEKTRLKMVQRKYFKSNVPINFLTWAEKEQIRYLHDSDSLEWSAERLAESFPASENVIKKIIKSRWKQDDTSKIVQHDQAVHNNWKLLSEGKLKIDTGLKKHLLKFGTRNKVLSVPRNSLNPRGGEIAYPRKTEFLNIIESYKKSAKSSADFNTRMLAESGSQVMVKPVIRNTQESSRTDTYVIDKSKSKNTDPHFTLSRFRTSHNSPMQEEYGQKEISLLPNEARHQIVDRPQIEHTRRGEHGVGGDKVSLHISEESMSYLEKIAIPKNKWKEGGTYKVGECYYDDDGEFLYRVPGAT